MPAKLSKEVQATVENGAKNYVALAKRAAPVDLGLLRNSISYYPIAKSTYEVVSAARYSPYLEFGTITKVSVPTELVNYAAQFKGGGLRNTGGITPHPYFFPQVPIIRKQVEAGIKAITDDLKL